MMEGEPVGVAVGADSNYQLTPELLEQHWGSRTVGALLASPSNPTGTLVPAASMREMAALARQRNGALIVDEIYHGLVYDDSVETALDISENVFIINSLSKYFEMTGWRLGWLVAPERYVAEIDKLSQNIYLAAPTPSQYAALAAFEPETLALLDARRDEFKARRDYLVPALRTLGFDIPQMPQGAFYIYAGCSRLTRDSHAFALDLLEKAGVAITPGIDFGDNAPERHIRFAYTQSIEKLQEGVRRIAAYLGR
jgi:aspartate/methionine/tyrosine aminotransferase